MSQYMIGDEVILLDTLTMYLANGVPLVLPPGTRGAVETALSSPDREMETYSIRWAPDTCAFSPLLGLSSTDEDTWNSICLVADAPDDIPKLPPSAYYSDTVPGFLREDLVYQVATLSETDGRSADYLLLQRPDETEWRIEVHTQGGEPHLDELECTFRSTVADGQRVQQFSLLPVDSDYLYVQIQLFPHDVRTYTYVPAQVDVDDQNHRVLVHLLFYSGPHMGYTGGDVARMLRRSRQALNQNGVLDAIGKAFPFGPKMPLYDVRQVLAWQLAVARHDGLVVLGHRSERAPLVDAIAIDHSSDWICPVCSGFAVADPTGSEPDVDMQIAKRVWPGRVWCPSCGIVDWTWQDWDHIGLKVQQLREALARGHASVVSLVEHGR